MKKALSAALITLAAFAAQANDKISYDYTQFGYVHSAGELTSDKTGYNLDISTSWTESTYLRLNYNEQSADTWVAGNKSKATAKEFGLGLGFHTPITRSTDFVTEIGYFKHDGEKLQNLTPYGNDEDGYFAKFALRTRYSAALEFSTFVGYKDFDYSEYVSEANHEDDSNVIYGIEGRYYLGKSWSMGISASEETTGLTSNLSIRFDF